MEGLGHHAMRSRVALATASLVVRMGKREVVLWAKRCDVKPVSFGISPW